MIDFSYWRRAMVLSGLVPSVRVSSEQRLWRQRFPTSQASLIKYIPHFPVWKQKTWQIWLIICYPILGFFRERTVLLSDVGFGKRRIIWYLWQLKLSSQRYKSKWYILLLFNALYSKEGCNWGHGLSAAIKLTSHVLNYNLPYYIHTLRKQIFRIFGLPMKRKN